MRDTVLLNYSASGTGMPVVMLHGFPLSSAIWASQQLNLSKKYFVITPDLRGHGLSPATEGIYDMDLLARDVLALLDHLHLTQVVIIGHSMGGYVALAAWHRSPERFLGLGLVGSQASADTEEGKKNRQKTAAKVAGGGGQVVANAMLPKLFASKHAANLPLIEGIEKIMVDTPTNGIIGSLNGMASRSDFDEELAEIDIPVLILSGEKDQIIPITKALAMAATIPEAILKIVPDAGHLPMIENPEATTKALDEFLSAIQASGYRLGPKGL